MRLDGFEPPTLGSEDRCSSPLSYRRIKNGEGGIRTLEGVNPTRFPSERTRPLCDLPPLV